MALRTHDDLDRLLSFVSARDDTHTIAIDCTASDEIADLYPRLFAEGMGVEQDVVPVCEVGAEHAVCGAPTVPQRSDHAKCTGADRLPCFSRAYRP